MKKTIYLTERDIHQMIKESLNKIMENTTTVSDVIRLYHSTNLEGIEGILESGIIDARQGHRRGETYGMNWFSTEAQDNFGRCMFSIDVPQAHFTQRGLQPHFEWMNRSEVSTYDSIDIKKFNFQIHKFGGLDWDDLKYFMEKHNNDEYELYHYLCNYMNVEHISNKLFFYLIEQLKGKEYLYDNYINYGDE
jgi:hypothetical protein